MTTKVEIVSSSSSKYLEQSTPFAMSMIFHLTLVSILALAAIPLAREQPVSTIVSNFSDEETLVFPILFEKKTLATQSSQSSEGTTTTTHAFQSHVPNSLLDSSPRYEEAIPLELSTTGVATGSLTEKVSPLVTNSSAANSGDGDGSSGTGDGDGDDDFFGLDLKGTSVVFVVDASGSMNFPHPGPAKTRFGRVKIELVKTIQKMTESERFFMIFFNQFAIPMPANRLVEASPANQQMYLNWMIPGQAQGDTEPEDALLRALRFRPEVIYFLTDGRFKYSVVKNVTKANRSRVVINTLCFGNDDGEKFLKQLANNNGGVYRFIPDEKAPEEKEKPKTTTPPKPKTPPKIRRLPSFD